MKRQFAVFALASLVIGAVLLFSVPVVLADLSTLLPTPNEPAKTTFTLKLAEAGAQLSAAEWADTQQVIENRLTQLQLAQGYSVVVQPDQQRVRVTVPQNANMPDILNLITHAGNVAFVDAGFNPPPAGAPLAATEILFAYPDIADVTLPDSGNGEPFYRFTLKAPAAARMQHFTAQTDRYVCLLLDETVAGCTQMVYSQNNVVEILPDFGGTNMGLDDLRIFMVSGALRGPLAVVN